ncbi:AMP-dependent synthetase/ligase [Phaeocystidibacter luteus]|uniref:AMP-binding protein n=1 Tax=Phaeocystidibacter luteus TaxID=911197 RepID=A0A6N6REE3_9FLAO|nr:AMP-dependent synthetase/ligase [Phaeocystidibacter luteus]KAB2806817.1 AMP-binding protein [Phaeocystidibacter luteus]
MNKPERLFDVPHYQLATKPLEDAIATKVNGNWIKISTQEYVDKATNISSALIEKGIQPKDKVALISANNRFEWNIMDIGILQAGAIDVPMYPTASEEDYTYIFNDSEAKMCFVSNKELYEKVKRVQPSCPHLKEIYIFDEEEGIPNWSEVLELGASNPHIEEIETRKANVKKEDLATLIYTSGTTGKPKGVMLSHWNICSNFLDSEDRLPVGIEGRAISFLPLCHIFERMLIYLYAYKSVPIYYAESLETIGDNIREVKPIIFTAVPRLLEKVYDRIMGKGAELTGVKKALFFWAVSVGEKYTINGRSGFYNFKLKIARKLIFSKWQEALGGNVKAIASGSAALNPKLARIFLAADINIQEGYGLTETSPVISVNCPLNDGTRIGTVGRPINNVQVKIADDGEILCKGPNVMMGYYNQPEKTAEVIDKDGWFHTGDIGEMVEGQYLKITDRKKEMFKTSGGKYVAPQIMENSFKESRFIEQIIVIGDGEKHPAAFVQPDFAFLEDWCKRKDVAFTSPAEIIKNDRVIERIGRDIDEINSRYGKWEQVKKFELTPEPWSVEGGELTPKLSLRRKPIVRKYAKLYENIYGHEPNA